MAAKRQAWQETGTRESMPTVLLWPVLNPERVRSSRPEDRGPAFRARQNVFVAPGLLTEVRQDCLLSQGRRHSGDTRERDFESCVGVGWTLVGHVGLYPRLVRAFNEQETLALAPTRTYGGEEWRRGEPSVPPQISFTLPPLHRFLVCIQACSLSHHSRS